MSAPYARVFRVIAGVYGASLAHTEPFVRVLVPVGGDWEQAWAFSNVLAAWDTDQANALYVTLNHEARGFVSENAEVIRAVASELGSRGSLTRDEVIEIMGERGEGGSGATRPLSS